jgi:hypothetical protein
MKYHEIIMAWLSMNNNGVINNGANGVQWRNGNVNISNENG